MAKKKKSPIKDIPADYEVGFCKPPKATQFKKGQSGNPRGRPKGSLNLATILKRAINEKIMIAENGRQRTVCKGEAVIKQLVNRAAQGDLQYIRTLLAEMNAAEAALAGSSGKPTTDLTDPSILAPLLDQLERGSHIVLSPLPETDASPGEPDDRPVES